MATEATETLSPREVEIAAAYAGGANYKEIAKKLIIAPATVRAHVRAIYRKLGVSTKIQLSQILVSYESPSDPVGNVEQKPDAVDPLSPGLVREVANTTRIAVRLFPGDGDTGQIDSFARGVMEDIVVDLSRFHRIRVLSIDSSIRYFESPFGVSQPAGALDFVLEGRFRSLGDRVRISIGLTEVHSGEQIWADRFDSSMNQIFGIQDQIVERIAATVVGRADAGMVFRASRRPPNSLAAYECVLRGKAIDHSDPAMEAEAREWFERAIAIDGNYALAHAMLAHTICLQWDRDLNADLTLLDRALQLAKKAASLDSNDPYVQFAIGFVHLFRKSFDLAEGHYARGLALSPNNAELVGEVGLMHAFLGQPDEALAKLARARQLDPYFEPSWFWHAEGIAHFVAGRQTKAIAAFERSLTFPLWILAYLAASEAILGDLAAANQHVSEILRRNRQFSVILFVGKEPLRRIEDRRTLENGLIAAGLPE